ncbi:MAG: flagellar biosynthetic protein FliO [Armatimonadetes bacterium]|nr:flagellar biosynthetic protein FliO [Armatimonadota bacterium]
MKNAACLFFLVIFTALFFSYGAPAAEKAASAPSPASDKALTPDPRPPTPAPPVQNEMVPDYKKYESGGFKEEPLAGYKNTLNYASIIFSVLFVCCLAFLGTRFLYGKGALGAAPSQRFIRILDRLVLQPQKTLYVIKAGEKVFLLGVGDQQITSLAELDARTVPDTLGQAQLPVTPFSSYLSALEPFSKMFRKKGKNPHSFIPLREEGNDAASHF